jgi:hypothetical protein
MSTFIVASEVNETMWHVSLSLPQSCLAGCFFVACSHAYVKIWHNNPKFLIPHCFFIKNTEVFSNTFFIQYLQDSLGNSCIALLRFNTPFCFQIEELISFDDRSTQSSLHWTQLWSQVATVLSFYSWMSACICIVHNPVTPHCCTFWNTH